MSASLSMCLRALPCLELIDSHRKDRMTQQREGKSAHPEEDAASSSQHQETLGTHPAQCEAAVFLSSLTAVLLFTWSRWHEGGRRRLGCQLKER